LVGVFSLTWLLDQGSINAWAWNFMGQFVLSMKAWRYALTVANLHAVNPSTAVEFTFTVHTNQWCEFLLTRPSWADASSWINPHLISPKTMYHASGTIDYTRRCEGTCFGMSASCVTIKPLFAFQQRNEGLSLNKTPKKALVWLSSVPEGHW
jgi:hypothetical protein